MDGIKRWLESHGLEKYTEVFGRVYNDGISFVQARAEAEKQRKQALLTSMWGKD